MLPNVYEVIRKLVRQKGTSAQLFILLVIVSRPIQLSFCDIKKDLVLLVFFLFI